MLIPESLLMRGFWFCGSSDGSDELIFTATWLLTMSIGLMDPKVDSVFQVLLLHKLGANQKLNCKVEIGGW